MINIRKTDSIYPVYAGGGAGAAVSSYVTAPAEKRPNENLMPVSAENLQAYHPSFTAFWNTRPAAPVSEKKIKLNSVKSHLDKTAAKKLERLERKGILDNNKSNDGSTVLDNLYKIVSEPRIKGLDYKTVLAETINALDNPFSITQKYGDIPDKAAAEIKKETGEILPKESKYTVSASCVAANIEFGLAYKHPAEFARFAADLSGRNYSVNKTLKPSAFSEGFTELLWKLREFNADSKIGKDSIKIKLKPDKRAAIRAGIQTKYKDKGERSCVDVLIQSALLNFGSQHTYNSITDKRTGKYNPDDTGLTDFEKNFTEQIVFETPKYSAVYQDLDENGVLKGYNCTHEETKQHILNSLKLGQSVIIGYTHLDKNKQVNGGHEITILGCETGKDGRTVFICNDTDDGIDAPVKIPEEKLLPLIHHAGISKEALNKNDVTAESWREQLSEYKHIISGRAA